jgi:hypothetical protein
VDRTSNFRVGKYVLIAGVIAAANLIGWNMSNDFALRDFGASLGYTGDPARFPGAYFTTKVRPGMTYPQTLAALAGTRYQEIKYYLAPRSQNADTLVVQRVVYALTMARDVEVNVVYGQNGRVRDVELRDFHLRGLRPLSKEDVERRLGAVGLP